MMFALHRRPIAVSLTYAACLAWIPGTVTAQSTFPSRPIRILVPFAPGGSADNLARVIQQPLSDALGQQLVLDNRPGASTTIGADLAARAAPDGHTLLFTTTTHTVNASLIRKLPFDPLKDFTAISLLVSQPNVLVVHPSAPVRTVKELVALAKAKPETLTFASGGNGSSPHLSGELLNLVAAIKMTHVPYKGSGPAITDLLGGHVKVMFAGPLAIDQYLRVGRLRALAIAAATRSTALPDLPTMAEAGVPGVETGTWYGMLGPAGMRPPVIDTIYAAVRKTLLLPDMKARLDKQGVDIVANQPREFDAFLRDETSKWARLVKSAGIRAD